MSSKMVPRAPSIITGIPHEPLIRVSEFIDTYGQHVGGSERKLGDITTTFPPPTFFQDKTRLDATAARCDILDEIEVSNTPFSDPTLFGLLKEWHDFLVTKAHPHHEREEAARKAKGVRPTWKSVHGRPGEGTDIGGSGSHAIGDGSREDEEVEESAEEEEGINENHTREGYARRAHERRPVATRIFLKTANMMADATSDQAVETSTSKSQRFTSDSHSAPASESAASATAFSRSGQKSSRMPRRDSPTSAGTTESSFSTSAQRQPRIPPVSNISIIQEQNMQRLQDYLTPAQGEDAEDTSAFLKTAIEVNIEKLMKGIASSPLASLNVDQRFEVPTSERPPINFRNISLPAVRSPPYRAITDPNEVVVTVAIQSNTHPSRRMQEVKLLGSNTLLDLRNAFMCPSDFTLQGHDEPPEGHPQQNTATRKASSSMFCIESCFYIDNPYLHAKADKKRAIVEQEQDRQIRLKHQTLMRRREAERKQREARNNDHASSSQNNSNMLLDTDVLELERELDNVPPTVFLPMEKMEIENEEELKSISEDYSTPIVEWASKDRSILPLGAVARKGTMAETTFKSLDIRLRHPYLFVHQGHCEHLVYFQDIRLFNFHHDNLNKNEYPITTFLSRIVRHRCRMCTTNGADYVTLDSMLADTNPCYFCERCFNSLHYDLQGRPLFGDAMRVFKYRPDLKEEVTSSAHHGELHFFAH